MYGNGDDYVPFIKVVLEQLRDDLHLLLGRTDNWQGIRRSDVAPMTTIASTRKVLVARDGGTQSDTLYILLIVLCFLLAMLLLVVCCFCLRSVVDRTSTHRVESQEKSASMEV